MKPSCCYHPKVDHFPIKAQPCVFVCFLPLVPPQICQLCVVCMSSSISFILWNFHQTRSCYSCSFFPVPVFLFLNDNKQQSKLQITENPKCLARELTDRYRELTLETPSAFLLNRQKTVPNQCLHVSLFK